MVCPEFTGAASRQSQSDYRVRDDRFIIIGVAFAILCIGSLAIFTDKLDAGWRQHGATTWADEHWGAAAGGSGSQIPQGNRHIPLIAKGGVFAVPVSLNGGAPYSFIIDSGASDVSVPPEIVDALFKSSLLADEDFTGDSSYTLADGSRIESKTFVLRTIEIGGVEIRNVRASVAPAGAPALLGQSFLARIRSWHINNAEGTLYLDVLPQ